MSSLMNPYYIVVLVAALLSVGLEGVRLSSFSSSVLRHSGGAGPLLIKDDDTSSTAKCGGECTHDRDCPTWTPELECDLCRGGRCVNESANCGQACYADIQCERGHGDCNLCMNHICTHHPKCNEKCHSDRDCVYAGLCWKCGEGKCMDPGPPKCGSQCDDDHDCRGASGDCIQCVSGTCTLPPYNLTCGKGCLNDTQCKSTATPDCGYCIGHYNSLGGPGVCHSAVCSSDCGASTGRPKDFCLGGVANGSLCWTCSQFCTRVGCSSTCEVLEVAKKNLERERRKPVPSSRRGDPCSTNEDCYGATDNESYFCLSGGLGCQPLSIADEDRSRIQWP